MPRESNVRPAADVTHPGGMRARRVFPAEAWDHLDPFVLFERFHIEPSQGFDTHPHRGFEIVSYVLEGGMAHRDSMGHESVARPGDAMRITTGSGMRHSELPAGDEGCSGLQLWINLPRDRKEVDPSYGDAGASDLPVEELDGATVTTVVGPGSPIDLHATVRYVDAEVDDAWRWEVPEEWNGFLYVVSGRGTVAGSDADEADCLVVAGGESIEIATGDAIRVAAVAGEPLGEPIRQRGPFVA